MGYTWKAIFRFTPENGPVESLTLDGTTLTDVGRPVEIEWKTDHVQEKRENILYQSIPLPRGFRHRIRLRLLITDLTNHQYIARIANRLADARYTTEMALDADEASPTYRRVVMMDAPSPKTIGSKWTRGARYDIDVQTADLLEQLVEISTVDGSGATQAW